MHIPVLQKEALQYLDIQSNENFIDCTIGEAGHALATLEKNGPKGKVLGIDWELRIKNKNARLILVQENFAKLKDIVEEKKFQPVHGILFDLGLSSWHLENSGRGFSFQKKESLDMRYSLQNKINAEKIVNYWSKFDIEKILKEYGEEKKAGKIAEKIIEARSAKDIKNTLQLTGIIKKAGGSPQKSFQALRIAVNDELNNLEKALPQALDVLSSNGRIAVISFHSLEDRIVKNFFKKEKSLKILTKKPVRPIAEELKINPRSRSAKLRVAFKI